MFWSNDSFLPIVYEAKLLSYENFVKTFNLYKIKLKTSLHFLYRQQVYERNAFLEPPNQIELDSGGSNFKVTILYNRVK